MKVSSIPLSCIATLLTCLAAASAAQEGPGLSLQPRTLIPPGQPYITIDTDEEAQARRVFKSPRWQAFVDTVSRESASPPDPAMLVTACRRAIGLARLTSTELLLDDCIADAIERVDRAGAYLDSRRYPSTQRELRRPPGAMGIEFLAPKRQDEPLVVLDVLEDGPAAKAGLRRGDLLESVDGVALLPLSHDDTIDVLRGEPGSVAQVKFTRNGSSLEAAVGMEDIEPKRVHVMRFDTAALYVRISDFSTGLVATRLANEVLAALASTPRPRLWILDLRGNPGGALSELAAAASLFVPPGSALFSFVSRSGVKHYSAAPPDDRIAAAFRKALADTALVLLVDGSTAGGAETLASMLRERLAARIVGEPTARIDNVTRRFDLLGEAAVKLTVGYMASASGQRNTGDGVPLDLLLANSPNAEFGSPPKDALLAAALEQFGRK